MSMGSKYFNQAPKLRLDPKVGLARIVGVTWEARQSNFAYTAQGATAISREAWPDARYPGRKVVVAAIWSAASASWVKQWARPARGRIRESGLVCSGWLSSASRCR